MCADRNNLKTTCILLTLLTWLPLLGCSSNRHGQRETALLRAEILDLEDQYYALKSRCEGAESQLQLLNGPTVIDPSGSPIIDFHFDESFGPAENTPCDCCPNGVHLGVNFSEPSIEDGVDSRMEPVARIEIDANRTHGENVDGKPGDDGIVVLVQPKSSQDKIVMSPAELTVSLIDPSLEGEKQRIGLWKFMPRELELFATNTRSDAAGYLLHLPWDRNIPQSDKLMLFVRYESPDGMRLESSNAVTIQRPPSDYTPDDPIINGWTNRDPRWDSTIAEPIIVNRSIESTAGERVPSSAEATDRGIPAIRAGTTVDRPRWRPTR